jgi:hypothetical protein
VPYFSKKKKKKSAGSTLLVLREHPACGEHPGLAEKQCMYMGAFLQQAFL